MPDTRTVRQVAKIQRGDYMSFPKIESKLFEAIKKFFSKLNEEAEKTFEEYKIFTHGDAYGIWRILIDKNTFDEEGNIISSRTIILILPKHRIVLFNLPEGFTVTKEFSDVDNLLCIIASFLPLL